MGKAAIINKFGISLLCFVCLQLCVSAQDLGSSNGLFNSPNPKTNSKTASKKTAAKTKGSATVSKKSGSPKTKKRVLTAAIKSNKSKTTAAQTKKAISDTTKQTSPPQILNDIVIKVGQPVNADPEDLFEQVLEEGNLARDQRNYAKAEIAYLHAQSLKKGDWRAIYGLGNLYSDQQRWEEAEGAYRTAIELDPNSPEAYVALSFILTQPIVGTNLAERYTEAEKTARRAIELDGNNAVAYDQLGVALELRGIISEETEKAYRKAIELDPNFALAQAHLGRLLRRKGLNKESSAAYSSAIQLATDVPTMILVADVMQSQQRYLESEQLLRRALNQDPKNPTALILLGRALTTRGGFEEAEKVLKKSADVSPNSFVSQMLLGSLFMRREKYNEAEKYLIKALKVVSPNEKKRLAQEFELLGDAFTRAEKSKDAARVYRRAIVLDQDKTALKDKLAKAMAN